MTVTTSLYEQLFPLTTIMKQRFVEWFLGKEIDLGIWQKTNIAGSGSFAMVDAVDEGYEVSSAAGGSNQSELDFNNIRHYVHNASVIILAFRRVTATTFNENGLGNVITGASTDTACAMESTGNTFKNLRTGDATVVSESASDLVIDTIHTLYKIVCASTVIQLYINGLLKVSKTTNRPTQKMQPLVHAGNLAAVVATTRIKFLEAYNT